MARSISAELIAEGWKSPNTYSDHYSDVPDAPGVYLFALYNLMTRQVRVAYVGQSRRLRRRWAGHPMISRLEREMSEDETVWRWFVRCDPSQLRAKEADTIRKFDPAYNVIGRRRGFA